MCDPTTKMCVAGTTTDTPQISFSGANVAENTSGSGASEAQPISMSRWLEKFGGGPRRGSLGTSQCNTHMGGLTPPSYDVGVGGDNSRGGTPGPAGVGGLAAKMFSGLGEYINFGANSAAGHQMNTPSQHDHDMMFGAAVMQVSSSTQPPPPESAQSNVEEYSTVARFLADEETATARDMEVERGARRMPSKGEASDISERVTRVIPMENFPVATNESLESLQELSIKRAARESSSGETDHVFSLDMDVIPEEAEGDSSRKSSREERQQQLQQQGNFKIAEKLLSSKATQNWFFQNTQSNTQAAAAEVEVVEAAARKAKEFHLWSPQTM